MSKTPRIVLVVDDEPSVVRIMTRVLERAGHEVIGCSNCDEVERSLAFGVKPDLAITDVVLEHHTGNRVASIVRRLSPRTHITFMSGHENVAVPGYQIALRKPFSARDLVALVDQVMADGFVRDLACERAFELTRKKPR